MHQNAGFRQKFADQSKIKHESIRSLIDDRPADGVFRVSPAVFTDSRVYELEMQRVFRRIWCFLGLESQIAQPNDFLTTHIADTPIIVARDAAGNISAFLNACRHKGSLLCRTEHGNSKRWVCPYHGWGYDTSGKNILVKDEDVGAYSAAWSPQNHDLISLPRFGSYKGLMFGCLSADVPDLDEWLGDIRPLLDMAMEQGPHGMEFVPGRIRYTYNGNWKLQMDNGMDRYHLSSTHPSFIEVVARREAARTGNPNARRLDWQQRFKQIGGLYTFDHGHVCTWMNQGQPDKRPISVTLDEVEQRLGSDKAEWMLKAKGITIFPNLQIADNTSLLVRTFRPLSVDRTEMRYWCLAPIGESDETRAWRIRQFEDFFNVTGLATPDDTTCYEDTQAGFQAQGLEWLQGYQRGMVGLKSGAEARLEALNVQARTAIEGGFALQAESCFHAPYREWLRLMTADDAMGSRA